MGTKKQLQRSKRRASPQVRQFAYRSNLFVVNSIYIAGLVPRSDENLIPKVLFRIHHAFGVRNSFHRLSKPHRLPYRLVVSQQPSFNFPDWNDDYV